MSTRRLRTALVLAVAAVTAYTAATPVTSAHPVARTNVVVEWNQTLLTLAQTPGAVPATVHPTRAFAIMSEAVFDAVEPSALRWLWRGHVSRTAAAAQAAHDVLVALFPSFAASLDQQLSADLATVQSGRDAGTRIGARAAAAVLARRASDGSDATPPPYVTASQPGDFRPSPPAFAAPVFTHWGAVAPFVLDRGDQFRPAPPPALSSPAYAAAINEVQSIGQDASTTRTAEQTTIGKFWAAPIQNYWNAIAEQVVLAHHSGIESSARVFALLDVSLADATIAFYDAKYAYRFWRPITAIRLADTDGNPATTADPAWTPLANTPADPSYPGAHSVLSATAAQILAFAYGDRTSFTVTSPLLPGVTRSFDRFSNAVTEAGLSRIYAGIHTRLDHDSGMALGTHVADFVLWHTLFGELL